MSDKKVILIYFDGTFMNRENGAHPRVADLISFVASLEVQVILYSYADHPTQAWSSANIEKFNIEFPDVHLVLEKKSSLYKAVVAFKKRLIAVMPEFSKILLELTLPVLTPQYQKLRKLHPEATLIANYASGLVELNGVDLQHTVIETHDLCFLKDTKALSRRITSLKTMLSARLELEMLRAVSVLIAIAPPEAAVFRFFFPEKEIFFIPTYQNRLSYSPTTEFEHDIAFVASDRNLNVEGLCEFLFLHKTWLQGKRFAIAGKICEVKRVQDLCATINGTRLLSYVDDLNKLLNTSKIVISPVDGTGLKIKVLEALAVGKPVFGSKTTLEGLPPGYENCAFPLNEESMSALLSSDSLRLQAELAAVEYYNSISENQDINNLKIFLENIQNDR